MKKKPASDARWFSNVKLARSANANVLALKFQNGNVILLNNSMMIAFAGIV